MQNTRPIPDLSKERIARFWSNVDKSETCWIWTSSLNDGYGSFRARERTLAAHRVAYTLLVGEIPAGLVLDHLCRTPACVNPEHLEPVTNSENIARGLHGVLAVPKYELGGICDKGHEMSEENIARTRGIAKGCKECNRESRRDYMREYMRTRRSVQSGQPLPIQ